MTDTQKEKILAMRMQGIGYHVIGRTLHLSENQVQLYAGRIRLERSAGCQ